MAHPNIASQIFQPPQPQLMEALSCIFDEVPPHLASALKWLKERQPTKTRELWEQLNSRGLIPDAWLDEPSRSFGTPNHKSIAEATATPTDMLTALCVASDPQGISMAERLAFEVLARLRPWYRAPNPQKIVWIFGDRDFWAWGGSMNKGRSHLSEGFHFLLPTNAKETALVRGEGLDATYAALKEATTKGWESAFSIARLDLSFAHLWERQAEVGKHIPGDTKGKPFPAALRGRLLREVKSPFAALVDLWALGYAFADFGKDNIVLIGRAITATAPKEPKVLPTLDDDDDDVWPG